MPWVDGTGAIPPQFNDPPKLGGTWRGSDFGQVMDRLAAPQGSPSGEFPDVEKPALTLQAPAEPRIRLGPRAAGPIDNAGRLFKPLADFLGEVNAQANYAGDMQEAFASGEDVKIHDVMIAAEKAGISVQLATQIRNKLLESYQEIWRMQV
jgi:flagellar hook-basal body complex protein FliE